MLPVINYVIDLLILYTFLLAVVTTAQSLLPFEEIYFCEKSAIFWLCDQIISS